VEALENGTRNGGTTLAVLSGVNKRSTASADLKIKEKAVFEVKDSRLAIGKFTRPLLPVEAKRFRRAWEHDPMPGFDEFELGKERISFVAPAENVPIAWKSIDRLLASATENVRKAS
jgi:hypothetical protein